MAHKFSQTKGDGENFTQSLAVFARKKTNHKHNGFCKVCRLAEDVLFELFWEKKKVIWSRWNKSICFAKKNELSIKKKNPARSYLELLPHRYCGSGTLVFSDQHEGCSMRDGCCRMYTTLCSGRPNRAVMMKTNDTSKIIHQDDTSQ